MRLADTNILIYAADTSPKERQKRARAAEVLKRRICACPYRSSRNSTTRLPDRQADLVCPTSKPWLFLDPFMDLTIQPVTQEVFRAAAEIANRHNISYWDAAIVAAARILGCDAVYSEDLNQGQSYDGVVVINPFR